MKLAIVISMLILILSGCSNKGTNDIQNNSSNYSANRLSSNIETQNADQNIVNSKPTETDIATFSTKIIYKDENRQTNINISCSKLNGCIVKAGETFSFCNTLGPSSPEDGYKKADTYESDGDIVKQYGGGKCQISSTLYDAVLQVPTLSVVERHAHSRSVNYVEPGKDAAVSYGSVDFKLGMIMIMI
jgi:vancomycin resistance protein YoaR